jgi:dolichyl-diphosphooligosaccharide--protein glycosyltransferase
MVSNQKLFSVGDFDFRLQHLLVIGVLALSVSISMIIRSTPASYGLELFEFDPFFNYRATEYILENGTDAYFNWIDEKSWYPFGRNVSETSQVTLHITAASLYPIFNFGSSLYDFTILLPLVVGSLTAIAVFAFVRVLGGTTAGLFAALIFSISLPIFTRGLIGWFKSEPLGLFFAFIAMYLFVSGLKFNKGKISLIKLVTAGFFLSLGLSAWGGILFFVMPIVLFYFSLPFIKNKDNFIMWAAPTFSISVILFSLLFERTSTFIIGYAGLAILLPTVFIIISGIVMKFSNERTKIRNCIILLISFIASGIAIINSGIIALPSFRYLNAINPFLTTQDNLTDSVAEHTTTSLSLSFSFLSVFLIFAVIGIWFLFSKKTINLKTDMRIFAIFTSIIAIYVSSAFIRLELFASVGIIILGSIGLAILTQKIFEQKKQNATKLIFPAVIIILFLIPLNLPENNNWIGWADFPPSILNGGSKFTNLSTDDWKDATLWIKENTSENAVIASWWDYGYWITTLSERTTIVDNATLIDWQIKKMAYTLMTTPENSWNILHSSYDTDVSEFMNEDFIVSTIGSSWTTGFDGYLEDKKLNPYYYGDSCKQIFKAEAQKLGVAEQSCNPIMKGMDADYLLIYVAGERFYADNSSIPLYTLEGGGDESKKTWFAAISNHQVSMLIEDDNITPTPLYMENSTLGMLTPFSIYTYVEPGTGRTFTTYQNGLIPVYINDLKLNDSVNDPFYLVYASPSFYDQQPGPMSTVLIYKINHDYIPQN